MAGIQYKNIWTILLLTALKMLLNYEAQLCVRPAKETNSNRMPEDPAGADLMQDPFFRGFSQSFGQQRNDNYSQGTSQQFNDGLCFYCKRPGHTARFCPFKPVLPRGKPATGSSNTPNSS